MYSFLSYLMLLFLNLVLVFLTLVMLVNGYCLMVDEIMLIIWIFKIMSKNRINLYVCVCACMPIQACDVCCLHILHIPYLPIISL
jgi:hypothetical protein